MGNQVRTLAATPPKPSTGPEAAAEDDVPLDVDISLLASRSKASGKLRLCRLQG